MTTGSEFSGSNGIFTENLKWIINIEDVFLHVKNFF